VDAYLESYFQHHGASAVVILRDGLASPADLRICGLEIRRDGIFLRFGPNVEEGATSGFGRVGSAAGRSESSGVSSGGAEYICDDCRGIRVRSPGDGGKADEVGVEAVEQVHSSRYSLDTVDDEILLEEAEVGAVSIEDFIAGVVSMKISTDRPGAA
jgi:hypothetical protein